MEEKIYRKQVFKGGLARTGTEEGVQTAYFSSQATAHRNCGHDGLRGLPWQQ